MRVAGIMSGTSLDGIDVAIVDLGRRIQPVAFSTAPYPKAVREAILAVSNRACHTAEISRLNFRLPELYAAALRKLCIRSGVPMESARQALLLQAELFCGRHLQSPQREVAD